VNQLSITPSSQTLAQLVFDASQLHADRIAIEEGDQIISYSELPDKVIRVTRALIAQGINQGDKVAIWAPNCADWVIIALGIQCAGAVMVPINTRMKGLEAANILSRSQSRLLFSVGTFLDVDYPALLDNHRPDGLEKMIIFGDSYKNNASPETGGNCSLDDFLETGSVISTEQAILTANSLTSEDIADLMFTSGTTGKPKGVLSSHGSTIRAFKEYVKVIGLIAGDRYLVVNPFFHSFGYKAGWVTCLLAGATILPHPVFNAEEVFQRITSDQITVLPGSPTLYLSMLAHPKLAETDLSSLRIAVTGAAAIPPILIERMRKELGFDVVTTAYGLTECGGLATICNPDDDIETIATTSGRAIPGTEIRIVDSDNQPLQSGLKGEICLRGFHIMKGYFNDPEATAEVIDDAGWLHTADVGTLDDAGYLRITDRLKDMFIVGGFNCYPAEIEATLSEHPDVAQVAVIGLPDERMGEVGCACIVLRSGVRLDTQDLISWSRERMANYKVPRLIYFYDSLPVNASNKVDKNLLRQMISTDESRTS